MLSSYELLCCLLLPELILLRKENVFQAYVFNIKQGKPGQVSYVNTIISFHQYK